MKEIFSAVVNHVGSLVCEGLEQRLLITFNECAPPDFRDYIVTLSDIRHGAESLDTAGRYVVVLNGMNYPITCWGEAAWHNLIQLGHVTLVYDNAPQALSYGAIHVASLSPPPVDNLSGMLKIIRTDNENRSD